jgi:hypothetical protein
MLAWVVIPEYVMPAAPGVLAPPPLPPPQARSKAIKEPSVSKIPIFRKAFMILDLLREILRTNRQNSIYPVISAKSGTL